MAAHAPRSIAGAALAAQGRSRVRPDATVESYLGAWLSHIKARVRARTHVGYEALISLHAIPHLGAIALEKLHPLDIQDVYARLLDRQPPLSAGTVLNLHLVLHNAFGQAVRWGLIPANPVAGAQPPRPKSPEPRAVDAD